MDTLNIFVGARQSEHTQKLSAKVYTWKQLMQRFPMGQMMQLRTVLQMQVGQRLDTDFVTVEVSKADARIILNLAGVSM